MVDALLLFLFSVRCPNYSIAQKQVNHRTHPVCVRVWRLMHSNFKQTRLCPAFVTHVVTFGPLPFVSLATSDYNVDEWLGIIICISHIVDDHKWLRKVPGKLSEAVRSDDHVRDNPGGQVVCFCAELFSVAYCWQIGRGLRRESGHERHGKPFARNEAPLQKDSPAMER